MGLKDVVLCDRHGAIYAGRDNLNAEKEEMAADYQPGATARAALPMMLKGADVFHRSFCSRLCDRGNGEESMNRDPILFPMANPVPEIMPDLAVKAGAAVVGTGRSDFANQINNVLAFPGIFRGALDVRASDINDEMKIAAAKALAGSRCRMTSSTRSTSLPAAV